MFSKICRSHNRFSLVLTVMISCFLISIFLINLFGFEKFADTDIYGETYLAKLMWEQKTCFPHDWIFGNQYYILATPNLSALLYGLTGSMNLSMGLASCAMTILVILSLYWFLSVFCQPIECKLGILLFLCSNICYNIADNPNGQIFFVMASYYSSYLITFLLVCGCYTRILFQTDIKCRKLMYTLTLLLSFATGMQSLRQMLVMVIPLLCVLVLYVLYQTIVLHNPLHIGLSLFCYPVIIFIANLSGYLLVRFMSIPTNTIYGELNFNLLANIKSKLFGIVRALCSIAGYPTVSYITNPNLTDWYFIPCCILMIFTLSLLTISFIKKIKNKEFHSESSVYMILCIISIIGVILCNLFFNVAIRGIYFFPYLILSTIGLLYFFQKSEYNNRSLMKIGVCIFSVAVYLISYLPSVCILLSTSSYKEDITSYLMENGYSIIYSNWYYAGTIASDSDGKITGGMWDDGSYENNMFLIRKETNPQTIYSEADNDVAVHIFTEDMLSTAIDKAESMNAKLHILTSFQTGDTTLYLYHSSKQLMH